MKAKEILERYVETEDREELLAAIARLPQPEQPAPWNDEFKTEGTLFELTELAFSLGISSEAYAELIQTIREAKAGKRIGKHDGPGPHESGSPQAVHGGRGQQLLLPGTDMPRKSFQEMADLDDEELIDIQEMAYDTWITWQGSKDIRLAAINLVGQTPETLPADPHVDAPSPAMGMEWSASPSETELFAKFYMDSLIDGQVHPTLYRAVDGNMLIGDELNFWENMTPGDQFDAPLLATLNVDPIVGDTNLLDKFGDTHLLEITGATGHDSGSTFASPYWLPSDEAQWLNDLEITAGDYGDEDLGAGDEGYESALRDSIEAYRSKPSTETRGDLREVLTAYWDERDQRFAGDPIPEDHDDYYSWDDEADYSDNYPREVISGGRFEVVDIADDPRGVYGKVVKLKQVGVFDPFNEGKVIEKANVTLLASDEWQGIVAMMTRLEKHFGPGNHPGTGTPQSIHGAGGTLNTAVADERFREKFGDLIAVYPEGFPDQIYQESGKEAEGFYRWLKDVQTEVYANEDLEARWETSIDDMWEEVRAVIGDHKRNGLVLLAEGKITLEEAIERSILSEYDQEARDLGDLPPEVFHVTTATESVLESGLKARDELAQGKGIGLGGGTANTISFTHDRAIAENILERMRERHAVLNDPATEIPRLVEEAKQGVGANEPWWDQTMGVKWEGEKADALSAGGVEALMTGKHLYRSSYGDKTVEEVRARWSDPKNKWYAEEYDLDTIELVDPGFGPNAATFRVSYTPAGHAKAVGDFMDEYVLYRSSRGGPEDPLFISNDDYAFAQRDVNDFSIIAGKTKPGTKGYELGALGEWRTWSGDVLENLEAIR